MSTREVLQHRSHSGITEAELLRVMVNHAAWRVPAVQEDGQHRLLLRQEDDGLWLQIFTDESALSEYAALDSAAPQGWVETTGEWLFTNLSSQLVGLVINPGLPEAMALPRASLPALRQWGQAVAVERALSTRADSPETVKLLAESTFHIAFVQDTTDSPQLALAPDPSGRSLAAVFTAPDTLQRYTDAAGKALGKELMTRALAGQELFANLSQMSLDGMVFNCLGPASPVAVTLAFTQAFLAAEH